MDITSKLELIRDLPTEEIITNEQLVELLETKEHPKHYIGFEVSGLLHIGALVSALKIKDFEKAGIETNIFLADYHAWINKKLGGDLDTIKRISKGYFSKAFESLGLNSNLIFASDIYDDDYWKLVLEMSTKATINRVLRCVTIMGRKEGTNLEASAIVYPLMQAADIFYLGIDIAHAGMDQRKVHMFAREINPSFVSLHHHLLPSLKSTGRMDYDDPSAKMSKSIPGSAIFLHDSEQEISKKIKNAYCPEKISFGNPVFEIAYYLIFHEWKELTLERPEKFGGDLVLTRKSLKDLYEQGKIHPLDLKSFTAKYLAKILEKPRTYFENHKEYIEELNSLRITR